jgi:sulfite exporter TauE/SafE
MDSALAFLASVCGTGHSIALGGIVPALFATGLVGGFAHCAGMCGPFVLAQTAARAGEGPTLQRLGAGLLPAYHLGRLTTYTALGALAGGLGATVLQVTGLRWVLAGMLGVAAFLFLLQGLKGVARFGSGTIGAGLAARYVALVAPLLRGVEPERSPFGVYRVGVALGCLPCGFLYAALAAAAASGGALAGGMAMAAFALGTVPSLAAVGLVGALAAERWRSFARALAAPLFLVNAATLAVLAARSLV